MPDPPSGEIPSSRSMKVKRVRLSGRIVQRGQRHVKLWTAVFQVLIFDLLGGCAKLLEIGNQVVGTSV